MSADYLLGVPFNIASYATLIHILCSCDGVDATPGDLIVSFGDVHLYSNHLDQAAEQLSRDLRSPPELNVGRSLQQPWSAEFDDFQLVGYDPHPAISAPVAV